MASKKFEIVVSNPNILFKNIRLYSYSKINLKHAVLVTNTLFTDPQLWITIT